MPESIARNTVYALAGQLLGAVVTAGLTLFLARVLGPQEFGVLSLAFGLAGLLLLPSDFGVSQSAARYAAEHRDDPAEVARVLASALRLKVFLAGSICLGFALLAGPIADAYGEPSLAWAIRAMALTLFGQNVMNLYGGAFVALGRTSSSFRALVSKSVAEAVATLALVLASTGAAEAALGRAAGFLVGGAVAAFMAARVLGPGAVGFGNATGAGTRRVAGYAGAMFVIDGAFALFQQMDVLLIGAILSAGAAGLFQAPLRLIVFLGYPVQALASGVAPRLASTTGDRNVGPFRRAIRYAIMFQAMLVPPMLVWAKPLIELMLGPDYAESAEVLRALAPFVFLLGLGTLLALGANYLGEARRRIPVAIAAVVVNLAIDITLIPEIGIVAGAIGTDVAFAIYVPAHLLICRRIVDIPLRPIAVTLLRSLLAAGAMAGTLALFGVSDVPVVLMPVGLAAGLATYLAVLVLTRETSVGELRRIIARLPLLTR